MNSENESMTAEEYRQSEGQPSECQLQESIVQWAEVQGGKASIIEKQGAFVDGSELEIASMSVPGKEVIANARLIAAAGTAAQGAREMGYDPQKAVEALPDLLARLVQIRSKLSASSLRREICVDDSMKEKVDEAVDLADDALASAEGSDQ